MKKHRFIVELDLVPGPLELKDGELFHQWKNVLRIPVGGDVVLSDGKGREAEGRIVAYGRSSVTLELEEPEGTSSEGRAVTLYAALLKRENFELVLQKATEVGVARIVPVVTARTVKLGFKMDRAKKIVREAAEQSGRATVPVVEEPTRFPDAVKHAAGPQAFFHVVLRPTSYKLQPSSGVWIGPEGGWTDEEVHAAREAGFDIASLGDLTLRAETAAIVASYLAVRGG